MYVGDSCIYIFCLCTFMFMQMMFTKNSCRPILAETVRIQNPLW